VPPAWHGVLAGKLAAQVDELHRLCERLVGAGPAAAEAADEARARGGPERLGMLRAALASCQARAGVGGAGEPAAGIAGAVAGELRNALSRLAFQERALLALRDIAGLSHEEIGALLGLDAAGTALALGRARVSLRAALRGEPPEGGRCGDRERALSAIERRCDGVQLDGPEDDWLLEHLAACAECARAHAAVLEAAACHGAWSAAA